MGGYRQWQLLKILDKNNTKTRTHQLSRWKMILEKWQLALNEKKDTIVLMDDNIDSCVESNHNKQYKIKDLKILLDDHYNSNNITMHNNKFTRFVRHQMPSSIDHIYSNCINKMLNVQTITNTCSDHAILTAQYNSNGILYHSKFIKSRNSRLLTKNSLTQHVLLPKFCN